MSGISLSIGTVACLLGVCVNTLRAWHKTGYLTPRFRTAGGHRRYDPADVSAVSGQRRQPPDHTVAYARVLRMECDNRGWSSPEIISDLGSGMNYNKKGLRKLLGMICRRQISRLVLLRKDRLLRFGAELVFELCALAGCEVVIIEDLPSDPKQTIVDDVLTILTVFSARCNGMRSHSNKKALNGNIIA